MAFDIAAYIDHTILKPAATTTEIESLCREAIENKFAAVCVPPYFVSKAALLLKDSGVKTATVVGFPFGYDSLAAKVAEVKTAIDNGADELDIVHNIAALKSGDEYLLEKEAAVLIPLAHAAGKTVKMILETGLLTDDEIIRCCALYSRHNVDFIKTSTGNAEKGASVDAVALMRQHLPDRVQIKASGGICTFAFAMELIRAGATRLGCSAGLQLVLESKKER